MRTERLALAESVAFDHPRKSRNLVMRSPALKESVISRGLWACVVVKRKGESVEVVDCTFVRAAGSAPKDRISASAATGKFGAIKSVFPDLCWIALICV